MIRPPPRFEASAGFWNQFCRRNWEKLPAVLPGVTQRPLATPDELFPALVEAAERHRSGASVPYRLYVDLALGGQHPGPYAEVELQDSQHFLPQREDGTLERYLARLIEQ